MGYLWVRDGSPAKDDSAVRDDSAGTEESAAREESDAWSVMPLEGGEIDLGTSPPRRIEPPDDPDAEGRDADDRKGRRGAILLRSGEVRSGGARSRALSTDEWVVIVDPSTAIRVNGRSVAAGVHALEDRDQIKVEGLGGVFFSAETQVSVEPAPPSGRPLVCPRCLKVIVEGHPAVLCPGCGVWHHQSEKKTAEAEELPCWTYSDRCAACVVHPTGLNEAFRWSPEDL